MSPTMCQVCLYYWKSDRNSVCTLWVLVSPQVGYIQMSSMLVVYLSNYWQFLTAKCYGYVGLTLL